MFHPLFFRGSYCFRRCWNCLPWSSWKLRWSCQNWHRLPEDLHECLLQVIRIFYVYFSACLESSIFIYRFTRPFNGYIYPFGFFAKCILWVGRGETEVTLKLSQDICGAPPPDRIPGYSYRTDPLIEVSNLICGVICVSSCSVSINNVCFQFHHSTG